MDFKWDFLHPRRPLESTRPSTSRQCSTPMTRTSTTKTSSIRGNTLLYFNQASWTKGRLTNMSSTKKWSRRMRAWALCPLMCHSLPSVASKAPKVFSPAAANIALRVCSVNKSPLKHLLQCLVAKWWHWPQPTTQQDRSSAAQDLLVAWELLKERVSLNNQEAWWVRPPAKATINHSQEFKSGNIRNKAAAFSTLTNSPRWSRMPRLGPNPLNRNSDRDKVLYKSSHWS